MNQNQNYRKKTGEFYTPSLVVANFMIDRVFNQLISQKRVDTSSYELFSTTLSSLSFCDPAIGTGNFVLGLLRWVWNTLKSFNEIDGKQKTEFFSRFVKENIYGVELNPVTLSDCKERISETYSIFKNEPLKKLRNGNSLVDEDAKEIFSDRDLRILKPFSWSVNFKGTDSFDVIIGNPPYFSLKKMGTRSDSTRLLFTYLKTSKHWKHLFRASSDIYYYFIINSLKKLKPDGIVSLITPNYWMENQYADLLRLEILNNQILEIIDLEGIKVFKDEGRWLNVSTSILTIQKKSPNQNFKVIKDLKRNYFEQRKISRVLPKPLMINQSDLSETKWILSKYQSILDKINQKDDFEKLGEIAQIAQGLSPGVKEVFVLNQREIEKNNLEKELLVPFVTNKQLQRWIVSGKDDLKAILPSRIDELSNYPSTQKYLARNKAKLTVGPDRKRLMTKGKIRWFDFSVYRNLNIFNSVKTKIMCPYRSLFPRFSLDKIGFFGATDTYAIVPKNEKDTLAILGILNSKFIDFWFREAGKRKGNMLEFFSNPLRNIPIPAKSERNQLSKYVEQILSLLEKSKGNLEYQISEIEAVIDLEIAQFYDFPKDFLIDYASR